MSNKPDPSAVNLQIDQVRGHMGGQEVFRAILPEDLDWEHFPAFPPSVHLAIVVGKPAERGPYTIRVRVPHGVSLMPHRHPEDRVYTVMSGIFYIGLGDHFDPKKLQAYPLEVLSFCPAIPIISTGPNRASTLRRSQQLVRLAWNTTAQKTIREIAIHKQVISYTQKVTHVDLGITCRRLRNFKKTEITRSRTA
jgi:hypothetical protein